MLNIPSGLLKKYQLAKCQTCVWMCMGPFFPENSSKMTRGSHQMAGLIVLYSIKLRVSLECGSLSRASLFGGFTVSKKLYKK